MAFNPLIDQGSLNRLRAAIIFPTYPGMNINAAQLTKDGIRLALEGQSTTYLPTLVGAVRSQEPYMMVTLTASLVKSIPISNAFKIQMETNSWMGTCTVRPDNQNLGIYGLLNVSITAIREMNFAGEDAAWVVSFRGYYTINSNIWSV